MKNFAIVIGINDYLHIKKLNYARQDAEKMRQHFINELQFEANSVKLLVSNSYNNITPITPIRSTIKSGLKRLTEGNRFGVEDNLWFFFSGHGTYFEELDYIMPLDGHMEDVQGTGIQVNEITGHLKNSGAGNIIMILDACRDEGKRSGKGIGEQTTENVKEKGIITFFSCSKEESSYEIEGLQGGAFTHALIEGMRQYATVGQLDEYIRTRVPQIGRENGKPLQNPRVIVNPSSKRHLILVNKNVKNTDIHILKNEAYQALYVQKNLELAEVLWKKVLVLSGATDEDALNAVLEIRNSKQGNKQNHIPSYSGSKTALNSNEDVFKRRLAKFLAILAQLLLLLMVLFTSSSRDYYFIIISTICWFLYWFFLTTSNSYVLGTTSNTYRISNISLLPGVLGGIMFYYWLHINLNHSYSNMTPNIILIGSFWWGLMGIIYWLRKPTVNSR